MTMSPADLLSWHPEIPGWSHDILPFYDRVASEFPSDAIAVEVGVYRGRSALFLADRIRAYGRGGLVIAVDPWDGTDEASHRPGDAEYDAFVSDRQRLGLIPFVAIRRDRSNVAASISYDASCDLVFIDAAHTYDGVRADILSWLRKVKPGGILGGHDYSGSFPGVMQAVDEAFPGGATVEGTVWWVRA